MSFFHTCWQQTKKSHHGLLGGLPPGLVAVRGVRNARRGLLQRIALRLRCRILQLLVQRLVQLLLRAVVLVLLRGVLLVGREVWEASSRLHLRKEVRHARKTAGQQPLPHATPICYEVSRTR